MNQKKTKMGQKWVFFKYSRVIYRWKAYGEEITTFAKHFLKFFIFEPKMAQKGQKNITTVNRMSIKLGRNGS